MDADQIIRALIAALAVLGLVIKGLLDYLRSRRAPVITDATIREIVSTSVSTATADLLTKDEARRILNPEARDLLDAQLKGVPCFGERTDCADKIERLLKLTGALRHTDTIPRAKR